VTQGKDCSPGEGGVAIGEDSESTSISLSKCLAACEEDTTCVAVVRRAQDEAGPCYMRSNINMVLCVADKELEVHMLNRGHNFKPIMITHTDSGSLDVNWLSSTIIKSFTMFFGQSGRQHHGFYFHLVRPVQRSFCMGCLSNFSFFQFILYNKSRRRRQ